MKKKLIGFSVAGALLLGSAGVYASSNSQTLEVFYNIKNIKINQVSKMPENKPFTYNGTTYVPLRFISEQLGNPVEWDSANQTINIGKTSDKSAFYPGRDLEYMNFQNSENYSSLYSYSFNQKTISDNIGNDYSNYITISTHSWDNQWSLIEFPLNGQYNTFKTTLGLTEEGKNITKELKLEVFLDEKSIETYTISAGDMPKDIELKLKGANKIGFKLSKKESSNISAQIGLFESRFYK
ncbi:copper amine oxidase N-terminal domain-containing protein [Lysinibacillus sp. NPDC056232]|uniref:copper amine oxidase N-terminal domain-containing protein n=1 Tax=Lysinibacillus sp. NPDC056232 TaxID=3345756 RepID=UPI0035DAD1CF